MTKASPIFRLHIKLDNDAFQDGNEAREVSNILRELANKLDFDACATVPTSGKVRDINGNTVGSYTRKG